MRELEEMYEFIGTLAMALSPYGITIYAETLRKLLQNRGLHDGPEVGIAPMIAAASQYWASKDAAVPYAINSAFIGSEKTALCEATQAYTLV